MKSVHYLSSRYYSERGQLYDASKQFRKEKKERRRRRLGEQDKSTGDPHSDQDRGDEEEDQNEEPDSANEQANTKSRKGKEEKLRTKRGRDMYKRMDGSALMVIGEYVCNLSYIQPYPCYLSITSARYATTRTRRTAYPE